MRIPTWGAEKFIIKRGRRNGHAHDTLFWDGLQHERWRKSLGGAGDEEFPPSWDRQPRAGCCPTFLTVLVPRVLEAKCTVRSLLERRRFQRRESR
jgi:hypothetical protein